jgi:hypothetical protein
MVVSPAGLGTKNDFAGEGQHQFTRPEQIGHKAPAQLLSYLERSPHPNALPISLPKALPCLKHNLYKKNERILHRNLKNRKKELFLARSLKVVSGRAIAQAVSRRLPGFDSRSGIWDLWWTEWHWDMFSPSTSVSPADSHFTDWSTFIRGWCNRPISGRHTKSDPTPRN